MWLAYIQGIKIVETEEKWENIEARIKFIFKILSLFLFYSKKKTYILIFSYPKTTTSLVYIIMW